MQTNSHKHLRGLQNNVSFVVAGDFGRHRCAVQVYPGAAGDDSMLRGTYKNKCALVYFSESLYSLLLLLLNTDKLCINAI